ncbi:MAG: radical SAM mobile pair protein B [Firmicutes bacterium]|nr:radical SAM mobile pair protein B [Bacillota bacterium]
MIDKIQEIDTKSILTKSNLPIAGYSVNPYVGCPHSCKYCYATFMKRFTNHKEPWGSFLDVKNWPPIRNPKRYKGETIIIGSVTDGYHPWEEKYRRTRLFLEQMKGSEANLIITTKSDLVLRDLDLIKTFPNPLVCWSINTLDEDFRADMDTAATVEQRIAAMKIFHDAGIRTTCFISPIFPGITDVVAIIEKIKNQCDYIWLENLNLRGEYKPVILEYIANHYPDLIPLYQEIYQGRSRLYWEQLDHQIALYAEQNGYMYLESDKPFQENPTGKPIIINYFYHEEIRQSAKK